MTDGDGLRERLGDVVLGGRTDVDAAADQLQLVQRAAEAEIEIRQLLQDAVSSARASGNSWHLIGEALGMSRQAAQQRFGRRDEKEAAETQRWLGPVTAFDEMTELEIAGRQGWHTVGCKLLYHLMEHSPTQWEHRRTVWTGPTKRLGRDGWQVAVRAFPWVYLTRDTGRPAATATTS